MDLWGDRIDKDSGTARGAPERGQVSKEPAKRKPSPSPVKIGDERMPGVWAPRFAALWSEGIYSIFSLLPVAIPTYLRGLYQEMRHEQQPYLERNELELNRFARLNLRADLSLVSYLLVAAVVAQTSASSFILIACGISNLVSGVYELIRWRRTREES